jgi:hypothetical protein
MGVWFYLKGLSTRRSAHREDSKKPNNQPSGNRSSDAHGFGPFIGNGNTPQLAQGEPAFPRVFYGYSERRLKLW